MPQVRVGGYTDYADAQAAMDRLSDAGLDIGGAAITWSGLRRIEYVLGRRTTLTAARDGLLSGAWLGLIVSLLLLLFVELDADTSELGLIVTWTLVFAAVGAAWSALMHASMRGTRDFTTLPRLEAERYDVWIDAGQAARARSLLGSRS
ncbi:MAG: general stress protein [Acidimicrobiales bacterium]